MVAEPDPCYKYSDQLDDSEDQAANEQHSAAQEANQALVEHEDCGRKADAEREDRGVLRIDGQVPERER